MTSTPVSCKALRDAAGAAGVHRSQTCTSRAVAASFEPGARRALESSTIRIGERAVEARQPAGQLGIVGRRRAGADQDRIVRGAQALAVGTRGFAGDPLALARCSGDAAIERGWQA